MIPYAAHTQSLTRSLWHLALLGVVAAALLTSFLQNEHVAFRYRTFIQSAKNLTEGQTGVPGQYDTAWQKLKKKSEIQIKENERKIEQIKTQRANASKGFRATYDRRVTELERRNIVLQARVNNYEGYRGETSTESK